LIVPDKLNVLSLSVLADSLEVAHGGIGANIAYNSALLGERPMLLGSIGKDGEAYIDELHKSGVITDHLHVSDLPTASFQVLTDRQHNQVGGFYPGAMADSASLHVKPWAGQNILFCLSAHDPQTMRMQVEECRNNKIRLCYDPGQQVNNISGSDLRAGVDAAELVIVNEYEHTVLCEKLGLSHEEFSRQVPLLIITHGSKGSVITGNLLEKPRTIKPTKAAAITDPTGAGDAYRAGFLYGYLRQWNLSTCGNLASVIASLIIEHPGTRYPFTLNQVQDRYYETYHERLTL
jgi:adenosine kinase